MDYQRIILLGNTTQDAEVKQSEKGEYVLLFVASKSRSGKSMFFPVFVSGKMAEFVKELKKGTPVLVDGSLDVSEYEAEGKEKRVEFRVFADNFRRLGQKTEEVNIEEAAEAVKNITGAEEEKQEE